MKKAALFLFLLLLPPAGAAPLRVVASFLPLYAAAVSIGGDDVTVTQLTTGGTGPHEFTPRPSDLKTIAAADLLIVNGLGLEEWLEGTVHEVASPRLRVVNASRDIAARQNPKGVEGFGDNEAGVNPHAWLDPVLEETQAQAIADAFKKADPAHAAAYQTRADAYIKRLRALDAQFRAFFAQVPPEKRTLVTFHDAFPYFAARYGLRYLGSIEEFPEKSPSPKELARLADVIEKNHVGVLFAEEGYEPKLLRTIAAQTGATVAEIDTLEVGAPDPDGYFKRMEANLATLHKAWIP